MGFVSLDCQICQYKSKRVCDFKEHVQSHAHLLQMKEIFPEGTVKRVGFLPFIGFLDPFNQDSNNPIVGVSLLTLCLCSDVGPWFFLCHVCDDMCSVKNILDHLSSGDHHSNYFTYTDPNALSFSWISGMDMRKNLWTELTNETKKNEQLQVLHLPVSLMNTFKSSTYTEVMNALRENDDLLRLFEAVLPKRTTIQTYQRDSNRKHPLLGLQHLVECICVGSSEKSHYICTLCHLTVSSHMIIKHVLSFDHIFCYFKAWHPSTLPSKESHSQYNKFFASAMLNLSKQSEQIHGTANTDIKQVNLEPDEFKSVNFTCYTEVLKKLESITNSSLITTVTPGTKLECSIVTPLSASSYKLRCQDCSCTFNNIFKYRSHLSHWSHRQNLKKYFGKGECFDHETAKFYLALYSYIQECLERNVPAVGAHLVVTCITTQVEASPIYICFACQDCFPQWCLNQHFTSRKHLVHTLLYQNPWRLPFAWEDHLEDTDLMLMAWEEEKERGPEEKTLKVFDIPIRIFKSLTPLSYSNVLERLELHHVLLKRGVPPCETYSKLQQYERFPLLGKQFLVCWYYDDGEMQQSGCLCLLCKRLLSDIESYAHVFSREHVAKFLNRFHPGSLNSRTNNVEILLDLAKQAAYFHPILHVQVLMLARPIREPCPYFTVKSILKAAHKKKGKGGLEPSVKPKMKLVPRETVKEVDKDRVNACGQKQNTNKLCGESGQHEENKGEKMTPTLSENESKMKSEEISSSEEMKKADKTFQAVKEKTEESAVTKPNGEIPESSQTTDRDDGAEKSERRREVPAQQKNDIHKEGERKRPCSKSEIPQKTACPNEDVGGEMPAKRQRLTSHEDTVCERTPKMPNNKQNVEKTADVEQSRKAAINEGSSTLLQCCCDQRKPNYLCECCSLKIPKSGVISHGPGFDHQETHLVVDMEIDDSEDSQAAADMSAMTDIKTTKVPPELNKGETMTHIKVPESADNTLTDTRSNEVTLSPNVSTSGKNTACSPPDSTFNNCKAYITPETTVASLKATTTSRREDLTAGTSKCTAASSKLTGPTSTSSAAFSHKNLTTKCEAVSRPPDSRPGAASKVKATSCNAAPISQKRPSVVREAKCRTAPSSKAETLPKDFKAVLSSEMPKTSVKCGNRETSAKTVHVKHSAGENTANAPQIHKCNKLAAPQLAKATTDKKPSIEPTHTLASDAKQKKGIPKVGLNDLILVSCEGKKQIYCELCSVKLTYSSDIHLTDRKHQLNYVKRRYPGQSLNLSKIQLHNIVENLAKVEKDLESRNIQVVKVNKDVYDELGALPQEKAIEKLKKIMGKRYAQASSTFTAYPAETLRRDAAGASPCEVSSTDDGMYTPHNEKPGRSTKNQPEQKNKNKLQMPKSHVSEEASVAVTGPVRSQSFDSEVTQPDDLIEDQLHPSLKFNENYPEPNTGPSIQAKEKQVVNREKLVTDTSQETRDSRQQQRRSNAELHAAQKTLEGEKTESCSRLSTYLRVRGFDEKPIIGLGSVWECQGISQKTFFLCESCSRMLSLSDICDHMISGDHELQCMRSEHDEILSVFWPEEDVTQDQKQQLLSEAVNLISGRERILKIDAKVVLLGQDLYESVRTAPFSEALKMVQNIKNEKKLSAFCLPTSTTPQNNQQLEDRQSLEESLPTEMQSSEVLETNQRSDKTEAFPTEARKTPDKPHLDETSMAEDLNGAKERKVSSPLDVKCFSSKADSAVSPSTSVDTCLSPHEVCSSLSVKQEVPSPPSQPQSPLTSMQIKEEELHSESSCFAAVKPEVSQTLSMSPGEKSLPTRKRPTDTPVETLISSCTNNPPEELPANWTHSPLQPITKPSSGSTSESTLVNPAATTAPLSSKDNDTEPTSDQQNTCTAEWAMNALIALVRDSKKNMSSCKFATDAKDANSCVSSLSENTEEKFDLKRVKTEFEACDSTTTTATGYENQIVTQANLASSASPSFSEDYLTRSNPLFGATEGKTASSIVPTATTADQPSYAATNHKLGQILQPQDDTKIKMTEVSPLPINTIITDRPKTTKHKFMGSYKVENHTEMNTEQQVSLSTLQPTSPSDTVAASGRHGQYSHSVYHPSEAVAGYITPISPAIHTGSLYQHQEYNRMQFFPSQLHLEQGANPYSLQSFGNSLATPVPAGWGSLEMQQPQQQQLMQQQLQQLMQQQQQITTQQQLQQLQQQVQQLQQQLRQLQPQLQISHSSSTSFSSSSSYNSSI